MIVVRVLGGLGNQMFQLAYAEALRSKGFEVKIDISFFANYNLHGGYQLDKFNIDFKKSRTHENIFLYGGRYVHMFLKKFGLRFSTHTVEKSLRFNEKYLCLPPTQYIEGYFQSEKYFLDIRTRILEVFTIKKDLSDFSKSILNKILNAPHSCSIHVRRGDFINKANIDIHGVCDIDYYIKAIRHIESVLGANMIRPFIFSDDIAWCRLNFDIKGAVFVDGGHERDPHEDMFLMSTCKHNIIANSSYSWWGAWLNQNPDKIVIAPQRWFSDQNMDEQSVDIICDSWVKV